MDPAIRGRCTSTNEQQLIEACLSMVNPKDNDDDSTSSSSKNHSSKTKEENKKPKAPPPQLPWTPITPQTKTSSMVKQSSPRIIAKMKEMVKLYPLQTNLELPTKQTVMSPRRVNPASSKSAPRPAQPQNTQPCTRLPRNPPNQPTIWQFIWPALATPSQLPIPHPPSPSDMPIDTSSQYEHQPQQYQTLYATSNPDTIKCRLRFSSHRTHPWRPPQNSTHHQPWQHGSLWQTSNSIISTHPSSWQN